MSRKVFVGRIPTGHLAPHQLLLIAEQLQGLVGIQTGTYERGIIFFEFHDHFSACQALDALKTHPVVQEHHLLLELGHPLPPVTDISKQMHQHNLHMFHLITQTQGQINDMGLAIPDIKRRLDQIDHQLHMLFDIMMNLSTSNHTAQLPGPHAPDNLSPGIAPQMDDVPTTFDTTLNDEATTSAHGLLLADDTDAASSVDGDPNVLAQAIAGEAATGMYSAESDDHATLLATMNACDACGLTPCPASSSSDT